MRVSRQAAGISDREAGEAPAPLAAPSVLVRSLPFPAAPLEPGSVLSSISAIGAMSGEPREAREARWRASTLPGLLQLGASRNRQQPRFCSGPRLSGTAGTAGPPLAACRRLPAPTPPSASQPSSIIPLSPLGCTVLPTTGIKEHIPGTAEHRATHPGGTGTGTGTGMMGEASAAGWQPWLVVGASLPWTTPIGVRMLSAAHSRACRYEPRLGSFNLRQSSKQGSHPSRAGQEPRAGHSRASRHPRHGYWRGHRHGHNC